ncbi:MAG: hypothetical protein JST67_01745 [Bacteroidetes bacterium]|nr:hypothetical protein [Bacteroidota bacterium]
MNRIKIKIGSLLVAMFVLAACKSEKTVGFTLHSLTLKSAKMAGLPVQNVYLKVVQMQNGTQQVLSTTGKYPSAYTLPVTFGLSAPIKMNLYTNTYSFQLYGDSSAFIGSTSINMGDYKIIYPLEMDTKNGSLVISLSGTWP